MAKRVCKWCGNGFETKDIRPEKGKFCSVSCKGKYGRSKQDIRGERNPAWRGGASFDHRNYNDTRRRWRAKHPEAVHAHRQVEYAISRGDLTREDCEVCGASENIHAHHDDYAKPLQVRWLCGSCHQRHHAGTL